MSRHSGSSRATSNHVLQDASVNWMYDPREEILEEPPNVDDPVLWEAFLAEGVWSPQPLTQNYKQSGPMMSPPSRMPQSRHSIDSSSSQPRSSIDSTSSRQKRDTASPVLERSDSKDPDSYLEDKRRRSAAASARCRARKKERMQKLERQVKELGDSIARMESMERQLKLENQNSMRIIGAQPPPQHPGMYYHMQDPRRHHR